MSFFTKVCWGLFVLSLIPVGTQTTEGSAILAILVLAILMTLADYHEGVAERRRRHEERDDSNA